MHGSRRSRAPTGSPASGRPGAEAHAGRLRLALDSRGRRPGSDQAPAAVRRCRDADEEERPVATPAIPADVVDVHAGLEARRSGPCAAELAEQPSRRSALAHRGRPVSTDVGCRSRRRGQPTRSPRQLRVALPPRRPVVGWGTPPRRSPTGPPRRGCALSLGSAHHRTRGGAGSPWPSCHEITGLRSTPIRSISASITSPGFR